MKDILPAEPFLRRENVTVTLSIGALRSKELQGVFEAGVARPRDLRILIFGGATTAHELQTFFEIGHELTVEAFDFPSRSRRITSTSGLLKRLTGNVGYGDNWQDLVGELWLNDVVERLPGGERSHITRVVGPRSAWGYRLMGRPTEYGNALTYEVHGTEVAATLPWPLEVAVAPWFERSKYLHDEHGEVALLQETSIITIKGDPSMADDAFFDAARTIAAELVSVASFLSRTSMYSWRETEVSRSGSHRRTWRVGGVEETRRRPLFRHWVHGLMETCLGTAVALSLEGRSLRTPISWKVHADETPVVEEKILGYFSALEKLVHMHAEALNFEKIVKGKTAQTLRRAVRAAVERLVVDGELTEVQRTLVEKKVSELERIPIRENVSAVLAAYGIDADEMLGATAFPTRHIVVHSSKSVPRDRMWADAERARRTVEALLLRMLGWNGELPSD